MPGRSRPGAAQRRRAMAMMGEELYEELGFEEAEGEAEGSEEFEEEAEGFDEFEEEGEGFEEFEEEAEGFEEFEEEGEGFEEEDGFLRSALGSVLGAEE